MQCENATCIKMAQNNAVYRRADGIVMIDPVKAKGQKQVVTAFPYRVIEWNEEQQLPRNVSYAPICWIKGEGPPLCGELPKGALVFGNLDYAKSEIAKIMASGKTRSYIRNTG